MMKPADQSSVRFIGSPSPLATRKIDLEIREGLTVSEIMAHAGLEPKLAPWYRVAIDGHELAPIWWDRCRPKAGRTVTLNVVPTGGGGGDDNKVLRTVLTIVVYVAAAVLSYFFPPFMPLFFLGASAITAGLQFLLPPTPPRRPDQDSSSGTFLPSITGARNGIRPWGPIPAILGRHRLAVAA